MNQPGTPGGRPFVHVVSVGRRMQDGWRSVDRSGPFRRFLAGLAVLVLAVPLLFLFILAILLLVALGLASALVSWVLGGRGSRRKPPGPTDPHPGRENVRVIPPR